MAAPLILARTFKDAHTFAREQLGLSHGYYRVVNSAGTIKAVRGVDLYLVPGWNKRPDRFTMGSAIKWCRLNIIDVAETPVEPVTEPVETPSIETSNGDQMVSGGAPDFTAFLTEGVTPEAPEPVAVCVDCGLDPHAKDCASNTLEAEKELLTDADFPSLEPEGWVPPETLDADQILRLAAGETGAEVAPIEPEAPKKHRRRRKCAECGSLHFKGDPCVEAE